MRQLPGGTLTFLFTDIEGSTKLLRELGDDYAEALARHRRLLREAFDAHDGIEVDTQGDAFFVAFARAGDALAAAAEAQHALAEGPIRVRMGLHTGVPRVTAEGYVGLDVHKGARIAACAHGGQVVLSKETRDFLDGAFSLTDLGEHRVKDFTEPVWIFQLGAERFPPLKSISNTNLPWPASSFVGREREVREIVSILRHGARLLTLSGPGGSGKTRLAIEAAAEVVPDYRNGVFWVGLAPLRDPALVLETIAQTLGAKDGLADHIGNRELMLALDNAEQVVDAAPDLVPLLEACPNLAVVVTSRELLRVRGEVEYAVPPLAEPEAIELFCQRSRLQANEAVAELCRRLDSLPLAVELAAARASVLSPAQILERLSHRLDLFEGGRDAETRQRTLRATIEWSHDQLADGEKELFRRLSVFAGGCSLDAAEQVAEANLEPLQSLVDKSLLRHSGERFWMLETIREYAAERLEESVEMQAVRTRHAEHFLSLAEEAEPGFEGASQLHWLNRLEVELDNFRAALTWACAYDGTVALRLVGSLWRFWMFRANYKEGFNWVERALAADDQTSPARAKALLAGSYIGLRSGAVDRARELAEQAVDLYRRSDDRRALAHALRDLANSFTSLGQHERATALLEESAALSREVGDDWNLAIALNNLGYSALNLGNWEQARRLCDESVRLRRDLGDARGLTLSLQNRSLAEREQGLRDDALEGFRESLRVSYEIGFSEGIVGGLLGIAGVEVEIGDPVKGARLLAAADALAEMISFEVFPFERDLSERAAATLREKVGEDAAAAAETEGRAAELVLIVDAALAT